MSMLLGEDNQLMIIFLLDCHEPHKPRQGFPVKCPPHRNTFAVCQRNRRFGNIFDVLHVDQEALVALHKHIAGDKLAGAH